MQIHRSLTERRGRAEKRSNSRSYREGELTMSRETTLRPLRDESPTTRRNHPLLTTRGHPPSRWTMSQSTHGRASAASAERVTTSGALFRFVLRGAQSIGEEGERAEEPNGDERASSSCLADGPSPHRVRPTTTTTTMSQSTVSNTVLGTYCVLTRTVFVP